MSLQISASFDKNLKFFQISLKRFELSKGLQRLSFKSLVLVTHLFSLGVEEGLSEVGFEFIDAD